MHAKPTSTRPEAQDSAPPKPAPPISPPPNPAPPNLAPPNRAHVETGDVLLPGEDPFSAPADGQLGPPVQLTLVIAPRRALGRVIAAAAARLCVNGPLHVVDGGNLYDAFSVARLARRLTPQLDAALANVRVSRAFTCYQVEALLARLAVIDGPLLALDLLNTFADENVPLLHRDYLAARLEAHLTRWARQAPVAVALAPAVAPPVSDYLQSLERAAGRVLRLEPSLPPQQWSLF